MIEQDGTIRLEAIASSLEAIASRLEAIALRLVAIALRSHTWSVPSATAIANAEESNTFALPPRRNRKPMLLTRLVFIGTKDT